MILTVPTQHRTLVETFGEWANSHAFVRFWGIAITNDGLATLQLPTDDTDEYRALLVPSDERVYLVMGQKSDGYEHFKFDAGSVYENPGDVFERVTAWLLEKSSLSLVQADFDTAIESAHIAWRIGHFIQDEELAAKALKQKMTAIDSM